MALWTKMNDKKWQEVPWNGIARGAACVICGSGPSLRDTAFPDNHHRYRICLNDTYQTVRPDMIVGLDTPAKSFYAPIINSNIPKIFQGGHQRHKAIGREAADWPFTYFADVETKPYETIFETPYLHTKFIWYQQTMVFAVHLAVWMGFRDIMFAGVDLEHGRHNGIGKRTADEIAVEQRIFTKQRKFFNWFARAASVKGMKFDSMVPGNLRDIFDNVKKEKGR